MIYPVTIIDNFFSNPDAIVEMASGLEYLKTEDGRWPGKRTRPLHVINNSFHQFLSRKLISIFYDRLPNYFEMDETFQLIDPLAEDKWSKENRGWIHTDAPSILGGIVYLTKDPDPDTGTSIYREKNGYSYMECDMKNSLYTEETVIPGLYSNAFDNMFDQFEETVSVSNVYNRLLLFDGKTFHGVRTFGMKPRLTLAFFVHGCDLVPPLNR